MVWEGTEKLARHELAVPTVGSGQVLIKIKLAGICGSDPTIFHGRHLRAKPPLVMGHEALGEIAVLGDRVAGFAVGNKVVFNPSFSCGKCEWCKQGKDNFCKKIGVLGTDGPGAFAEYILVGANRVYRLPDDISDYIGILTEPLAVAVHAINTVGVRSEHTVLVVGGGAIGLLAAAMARLRGATTIMVMEIKPFRLQLAEKLGFIPVNGAAENVFERVLAETKGQGVDVVLDATGSPAIVDLLTLVTKRGGTIGIVGIQKQPAPLDLRAFMYKELKMYGSFIYVPQDFSEAVDLIIRRKIATEAIIVTHEMPLEQASEAIATAENAANAVKVVLNCLHLSGMD
jgi:2-desacetyl-2-hydroxyethyl bacteriochlorophyllide A dehydrogenase